MCRPELTACVAPYAKLPPSLGASLNWGQFPVWEARPQKVVHRWFASYFTAFRKWKSPSVWGAEIESEEHTGAAALPGNADSKIPWWKFTFQPCFLLNDGNFFFLLNQRTFPVVAALVVLFGDSPCSFESQFSYLRNEGGGLRDGQSPSALISHLSGCCFDPRFLTPDQLPLCSRGYTADATALTVLFLLLTLGACLCNWLSLSGICCELCSVFLSLS